MQYDDDDGDISDFFDDEDTMEIFREQLETAGLVASTMDNGVLIAFSADKLKELIDIAEDNDDKKIVIFIRSKEDDKPEVLN